MPASDAAAVIADPSRWVLDTGGTVERTRRRGRDGGHQHGDQLSADRELPCPSARTVVSAYTEYELSVVTTERPAAAKGTRDSDSTAGGRRRIARRAERGQPAGATVGDRRAVPPFRDLGRRVAYLPRKPSALAGIRGWPTPVDGLHWHRMVVEPIGGRHHPRCVNSCDRATCRLTIAESRPVGPPHPR